jgi:enoyl-[acyl-carrier protein] reductase II
MVTEHFEDKHNAEVGFFLKTISTISYLLIKSVMDNRITRLFDIKYPIIQGGMVWCSGWRLASAVSNCGGLGLLGAGSMHPETLLQQIQKMKHATDKPWGVNVPLLNPGIEELMQIIISEGVKIIFTAAGSPAKFTSLLKSHGITVVHVIANSRFAARCEAAGVDAIVAEGFEAGGHNGREETTTMNLIPIIRRSTALPLIAAGGIGSGEQMLAAMALGAEGVQIGSLFALSKESSAHDLFKQYATGAKEGDTMLALKKITPTRLLKNAFFDLVKTAEDSGATSESLSLLLGRGRTKKGIFEGDLENGELEIGQVAALIKEVKPVVDIFDDLLNGYTQAWQRLSVLQKGNE